MTPPPEEFVPPGFRGINIVHTGNPPENTPDPGGLPAAPNRWAAFTTPELDWLHLGVDDVDVEACQALAAELAVELERRASVAKSRARDAS